mmetsp:Transcript_22560/g.42009  ORF Transcript_22560/g.42009 Transcript_22560/m.42009 type:complete len:254 (-) Transcript_22560:397-1158(-)
MLLFVPGPYVGHGSKELVLHAGPPFQRLSRDTALADRVGHVSDLRHAHAENVRATALALPGLPPAPSLLAALPSDAAGPPRLLPVRVVLAPAVLDGRGRLGPDQAVRPPGARDDHRRAAFTPVTRQCRGQAHHVLARSGQELVRRDRNAVAEGAGHIGEPVKLVNVRVLSEQAHSLGPLKGAPRDHADLESVGEAKCRERLRLERLDLRGGEGGGELVQQVDGLDAERIEVPRTGLVDGLSPGLVEEERLELE